MDYLIGQIEMFPYNFVPMGWMACEGQILQIQQNSALYSLLGTQFGGNGTTNFALPDLRNANANPLCKYYICTMGIYPSRS